MLRFVKKYLVSLAVALGLLLSVCGQFVHAGMVLSPGMVAHTHTDANTGGGTLSLGGTLSSAKACASTFTRVGPNYCAKYGAGTNTWVQTTNTAVCTQSTALSGVTDAKAVMVSGTLNTFSTNAVGSRLNILRFYGPTDTACATAITNFYVTTYEHVAVAVNTILGVAANTMLVPTNSSGQFYAKNGAAVGDGTLSNLLYVIGYYD